jgi:hypothetical protein
MKLATRVFAFSVPAVLVCLAPVAFAQSTPKESKAERLTQLRVALTHSDETVAILESLKSGRESERAKELESAKKARNAVQRLINQIEGRDENAGIVADQKRVASEKRAATADYYPALQQVKQDLELDYNILQRDPGEKNDHRNNAMKFIDEVHRPIVKEIEEYERAHPAAAAPAAPAPAASPAPAAPPPATPAAPAAMPAASAQQIAELNDAISHLDHSIDDIAAQPASDPLRQQTLAGVTKARDTVRQLVDELHGGDATKDQAADHARDAAHSGKTPDYYTSLVQVQEYLHNDTIVISRQGDDAKHLHEAAIQSMADANKLVQQQVDAYRKTHPSVK